MEQEYTSRSARTYPISINSIMDSLSIWDNMQTLKEKGYYGENSYTEEVLYQSIFGEQETKMEMIQQFVLQLDGNKTDGTVTAALGIEDNILSNVEPWLTYAATPSISMDMAADCTSFAQYMFAIFNTTENLTTEDGEIGIGRAQGQQRDNDLYNKGNTTYSVGDFVYLDTHKYVNGEKVQGQDGQFDHVVLIVGIGKEPDEYIVAQAKNPTYDFTIGNKTFRNEEIMGTLNILGDIP